MAILLYDAPFPMPDDVKKIVAVAWTAEQLAHNAHAKRLTFYQLDAVELAGSADYPIGFCRFGSLVLDRGQCFVLPFQQKDLLDLLKKAQSFLQLVERAFGPSDGFDEPVVVRTGYYGGFTFKVKGEKDVRCERLSDAFAAYRRYLDRESSS